MLMAGMRDAVEGKSGSHSGRRSPAWRRRIALILGTCTYLYFLLVLIVGILLQWTAEEFWFTTLLVYGPRWVWALPLGILVPAAALARRRLLWILLAALLVVIGPVMGLRVSPSALLTKGSKGSGVRVLTCNVGSSDLDADALARLVAESQPDVVAAQEWWLGSESTVFRQPGWHVRVDGGLCLASRYPIQGAGTLGCDELGGTGAVGCYDLQTPGGILHFFNVHLSTARDGLQEVIDSRWRGISTVRANTSMRWHGSEVASQRARAICVPLLLAGDFNMPVESAIYRQCWSRFSNAFDAVGLGLGHTKFTRWHGVRIDHILAGPGWRFRRCWVGPDVKSDHLPLIADVEWFGASEGDE
jgi:endonuclease/exonuclease/phosphatase family metal-dependent hydrolase